MGTLVEVPEWTLIVAVVAWIVTQVFTIYGAKWVIGKAREESQAQKDEVVAHFDKELSGLKEGGEGVDLKAEIEAVQAHIQGIDNALGAKFEAWDVELAQMPARMLQAMGSEKGVEMKALYKSAAEGEEQLETYMAENMEASEVAMARVAAIEPNDDWKAKHPLGAMLVEGGKEWMRAKMDEARGVVTMTPGGRGRKPKGFR